MSSWWRAILLGSEGIFETAGSLWGGKQVFITAKVLDHVTAGGDEIRPFVVVSAWPGASATSSPWRPSAKGTSTTSSRSCTPTTLRSAAERLARAREASPRTVRPRRDRGQRHGIEVVRVERDRRAPRPLRPPCARQRARSCASSRTPPASSAARWS
jgi:hypothetical protein